MVSYLWEEDGIRSWASGNPVSWPSYVRIYPPAARVKQPDRYGRMYQLYKLLIYFVSAAQIRRSASGYGRKRKTKKEKKKEKKRKKLVPVSWRPHAYPGDLGSAGYISPRIYLTPASYLLGWLGSRPALYIIPSAWALTVRLDIYTYTYVLVILLFLSFFSRREWTNNQEKKKKCKLEWNGVEKRNIENKSSTKVSDHQTTSLTKAAIIKTRQETFRPSDYYSFGVFWLKAFSVRIPTILHLFSRLFLFLSFLIIYEKTSGRASTRATTTMCIVLRLELVSRTQSFFFFLFFYFLFSSLFWARRGEGPLAPTGSYSNSAP